MPITVEIAPDSEGTADLMQRMRAFFKRKSSDERGVESVAMIIVLPTMFVLLLALLEVGFYVRARMLVENEMRDTVRRAAADGGNYFPRSRDFSIGSAEWDDIAFSTLYRDGRCTINPGCSAPPEVDCRTITTPTGGTYRENIVQQEGDLITCRAVYHYKPINKPLLDSPLGLFTGSMIRERIEISVTARSETGLN